MSKYRHYSNFPDERNFHLYIVEWKSNAIVCRGDPDKLSECRQQSIALMSSNLQSFISIRHSSVVKALACCSEGGWFDSWSALFSFNRHFPQLRLLKAGAAGVDEHYRHPQLRLRPCYLKIIAVDPRVSIEISEI